ncbi:hypothetical protein K1719_018015 [Acacia pycnantha]|nr:hypothetical protein K1719_018015 [Acacia pycnantha]
MSIAVDRHDKEKRMAIVLLSTLCSNVINPAWINDGFFMLLQSANELIVNIQYVVGIIVLFVPKLVLVVSFLQLFLHHAELVGR